MWLWISSHPVFVVVPYLAVIVCPALRLHLVLVHTFLPRLPAPCVPCSGCSLCCFLFWSCSPSWTEIWGIDLHLPLTCEFTNNSPHWTSLPAVSAAGSNMFVLFLVVLWKIPNKIYSSTYRKHLISMYVACFRQEAWHQSVLSSILTRTHICSSFICHLHYDGFFTFPISSQQFSFLLQRHLPHPCSSMPLSFHRVCALAAFQPAPGCQLIVDNYSYLTAAFTASPFWRHLERENIPSAGPSLPQRMTPDTMADWIW